jgi:hypothetical protein
MPVYDVCKKNSIFTIQSILHFPPCLYYTPHQHTTLAMNSLNIMFGEGGGDDDFFAGLASSEFLLKHLATDDSSKPDDPAPTPGTSDLVIHLPAQVSGIKARGIDSYYFCNRDDRELFNTPANQVYSRLMFMA